MSFTCETTWSQVEYFPLVRVVRQSDETFSSILTKLGDGRALTADEKAKIESLFVTTEWVNAHEPEAIRLFFTTEEVEKYNFRCIQGPDVIEWVTRDEYSGYRNKRELNNARSQIHKLDAEDTGMLAYLLCLKIGLPYMIRTNIDIIDKLVNSSIGTLRDIEW